MIGAVFNTCPSFQQYAWRLAGVVRRDDERLDAVPGSGFDQHVCPAAGGPHHQIEALVVLGEDEDIVLRFGAELMPPDLVGTVQGVGDDVEERPRAGRPGQLVVGALDALGQVGAAGQIAHPELVDLVAVEIDRVREQPPVGADLADPEGDVTTGAGGVVQQEVFVEEYLRRAVRAGPAELLVLAARDRPGEIGVTAAAPADRLLRLGRPPDELSRQLFPQPAERFGLLVVVGPLGREVVPHGGSVPVAHPGVRVLAAGRAAGQEPGRLRRGHHRLTSNCRSGPAGSR
jgi:hypothetical protein